MRSLLLFLVCVGVVLAGFKNATTFTKKDRLSEYGFFKGRLSDLEPAEGILAYQLNTPLFSNYAEKLRFVKIPDGQRAAYNDSVAFTFPVGTVLIKNFYYPNNFKKPELGRKILETRLLVRTESGWEALPYIWSDDQEDALYDPAGETKMITYINAAGKKITTPYAIPNRNQCKGCHIRSQILLPIGPTARQLNTGLANGRNQLLEWQARGLLTGLPELSSIPKLAVWNDHDEDLNMRARAYLDANCGHCHNKLGPANTSGLFLDIGENDPVHLGVNKAPVAAGRGAGELSYDIVEGQPHKSILWYRMNTIDPAIAMPEIGREQIHQEGVALIQEWIKTHNF